MSVFIGLIPPLKDLDEQKVDQVKVTVRAAVSVPLFLTISILTATVDLLSSNPVREQYCVKSA